MDLILYGAADNSQYLTKKERNNEVKLYQSIQCMQSLFIYWCVIYENNNH